MANALVKDAVDRLARRQDLGQERAAAVLAEIMDGNASEVEIAAFLIALRTKGETVEEVAGLARTMRDFAARVDVRAEHLLDTAGTGGGRSTFNVSTTAALIAAGAGCAVAKHGNRSATSLSGSADLLEALGARIDLDAEDVARTIEAVGFGFMFAPVHHRATRYVVPVRRELAVRTVFNLLGPLTNPAGAERQLIGVADPDLLELIAGALALLGTEHALVVSAQDGLDEISAFAPTQMVEVREGRLRAHLLDPAQAGVTPAADVPADAAERSDRDDQGPPASWEAPAGGSPEHNAALTRAILAGHPGPARALALINAGAAIYVAGRAQSIAEGVQAARASLAEGAAAAVLEAYVSASHAGQRSAGGAEPSRQEHRP
ncbi:MAG TPA: anthranilate phosphoribosyltransferase [Solirubrobacteraceae bacterium]|nr:anthranilate phosphoribosyltransferase [Solirubrobacteraceae bacterium]